MKNLKKGSVLYILLIFSAILGAFCNSASGGQGLAVGETIPNPEIKTIDKYEGTDRVETRLYDYKQDQVLLIAFMPSVNNVDYANIMTGAFDTYFAEGLSFRSFEKYTFANPKLRVIVVTPDNAEVLKEYAKNRQMDFDFVSDTKMDAANLFGISNWESDKTNNGSFVYIIDKDNKVVLADYSYKGQGEKLKQVQTELYSMFGLKEDLSNTQQYSPLLTGERSRDFDFKYISFHKDSPNVPPSDVREAKLSDYIGKKNVLIAFYPAAYSFSCSFEASTLDHWAEDRMLEKVKNSQLNDDDLEILMVSVSNKYILSKWTNDMNLNNVNLVIDENAAISKAYSSYSPLGYNKRTVFLIDKEGLVKYINWDYKVDDNDFALLRENVMALK